MKIILTMLIALLPILGKSYVAYIYITSSCTDYKVVSGTTIGDYPENDNVNFSFIAAPGDSEVLYKVYGAGPILGIYITGLPETFSSVRYVSVDCDWPTTNPPALLPPNDLVDGDPDDPDDPLNNNQHGCNGDECGCGGMPVWSVSEPFLSVWLNDEPLGYQPAIGSRISFKLSYKLRELSAGYNTNVFNIGKKWNCSWISYIGQDANTNWIVHLPGGKQLTFNPGSTANNYLTYSALGGNATNGFTLSFPNGSESVYGLIVTNSSGAFQEAFLTQTVNAQGQKTLFNYSSYAAAAPVIRLQSVVDGAGRTNWVYYNNTNLYCTNLISQVTDAFGRNAYLAYNTNGDLTNITDVANNSSTVAYLTNDYVSSLTTPYGVTSFAVIDSFSNPPAANGRAVTVTRADGSHELYVYENRALGIAGGYPGAMMPSMPADYNYLYNYNYLNLYNSFHWGPRQYAALSTTIVTNLVASDFALARMKHWLLAPSNDVENTLSMERDPSQDAAGMVAGQMTWYDYDGKTNEQNEGSQILPTVVGRVLPDNTTQFTYTARNSFGIITNQVSTYSAGGGIALRTNSYVIASNAIDPLIATNALGIVVSSNAFNANHEITANFDASNELTACTYDGSNRLTSLTTPAGLVTTNIYGADGFLAQQITVGFATNSYTYTNGLVYTHTDERGLTTTNTWDNLNRLTSTIYPDTTYISNIYTILDLTASKDRLGHWTYYGYDSMRRKTAETNADNEVTLFNYCSCGALESITDAGGNSTKFAYDNQANRTNIVYADNYSITNIYDLLHRVIVRNDSWGNSVTNIYNNQSLLVSSANSAGLLMTNSCDVLDRITNSLDANHVSVNTTYDNLNRMLSRSYPDNGIEYFGYTRNFPALTSYTNQIGNVYLYGYDIMNRKTNDACLGISTNSYQYDGAGDRLALTDGNNNTTDWGYDTYGRMTNKVDAANNLIFAYTYDPDNRLTNRWSATKGNTIYYYDALGNLTNVTYPISPAISLSYDKLNRLTNMVDAVGTTVYGYNQVGQLLSAGGLWPNDGVNYSYDSRLRMTMSVQAPNASAWTQYYGYDLARRLTDVASPVGQFGYTYDPVRLQRVDLLTLPGGGYITNQYDNVARQTLAELVSPKGTNLDSYLYGYNQASQRTNVIRTAGDYVDYGYDNEGELKSAVGVEPDNVTLRKNEDFQYYYDNAGNLRTRHKNALNQSFRANALNQYTNIVGGGTLTVAGTTTSPATNVTVNGQTATLYVDNSFSAAGMTLINGTTNFTAVGQDIYGRVSSNTVTVSLQGTNSYSYDLNGNLLSDGTRNFGYDDENELISVWQANAWSNNFVYDGKKRRRIERDYSWNGSSFVETNEVHFIYDGNVVVQERNANNLPMATYTRGNDLSGTLRGAGGIGGLLARTDMGQWIVGGAFAHALYHADGNGNVTCLMYTNGLTAAKYLYDPFGNTLAQYGLLANANNYRFSSKEWNGNSGLYYYLHRFYDPNLQQWLNHDPIEERGGINLYCYVGNNPLNHIDPLGLSPYFDENYGDISSYQNTANLPVIGAYVGVGVAAGVALTGVGLVADSYGGAILATLGIGGGGGVVAGSYVSSEAVLAAIDAVEAAEAAASQAELNYLVAEGNLVIATDTGCGELIAIANENVIAAEWAVVNTGNQLEFALAALRALTQ